MEQEKSTASERTRLERVIEALLFASDTPLSTSKIAAITGSPSTKDIRSAIKSLADFYKFQSRSYEVIEVAGGYQITTLPEFSPIVTQLFKSRRKAKLSKPALETLAIIAYKQPISRIQIEAIRGVNCEGVLATLTDRELIAITGRGEGVGRPYLYSTTRKFLEYLGLKDYRDLPSIEELEHNLEGIDISNQTSIITPEELEAGSSHNEPERRDGEGNSTRSNEE